MFFKIDHFINNLSTISNKSLYILNENDDKADKKNFEFVKNLIFNLHKFKHTLLINNNENENLIYEKILNYIEIHK
jgi:hypothetical protein